GRKTSWTSPFRCPRTPPNLRCPECRRADSRGKSDLDAQPHMGEAGAVVDVLPLGAIPREAVSVLLRRFGLQLQMVPDGDPIPGSYWGEPEAGIIGTTVFARGDTPIHSLLHEACHLIVLPQEKRAAVHTDA